MTLALGIFDVFTYAIPGSLYLSLLAYAATRSGLARLDVANDLDTTVALVGGALASYLLGHLTYGLGHALNRLLPPREHVLATARKEFTTRVPGPRARQLVEVDSQLLLAAVELRSKEAGVEIIRLRAVGLMLLGTAPPLLLAAVVAVVETVAGPRRAAAACCAVLFLVAAVAAVRQGRKLRRWAILKTLELAFWVTAPDDAAPPQR